MKRMRHCWNCMRKTFAKIHLVDRCLILFMFILLLQSAYSLFFPSGNDETGNIDIIVRTSSASIFGYFLSVNFIRTNSPQQKTNVGQPKVLDIPSASDDGHVRSRIGFESPQPAEPVHPGSASSVPEDQDNSPAVAGRLQIITATAVGLFCLLALIFVRNLPHGDITLAHSTSAAATLAQFRDFVSGCVGFLIGCPTTNSSQSK